MTNSKQPKPETKQQTGELTDAALNQATGAMLACMPTDQLVAHGTGGGGGAGKPAMGDGSVRTIIAV